MGREKKFKVGNLVIHSGSFFKYGINCASQWGIILDIEGPQIDFGRRRSMLIHWSPGSMNQSQKWTAPRDIYLVNEVVNGDSDYKLDNEYLEEEYTKTLKLS